MENEKDLLKKDLEGIDSGDKAALEQFKSDIEGTGHEELEQLAQQKINAIGEQVQQIQSTTAQAMEQVESMGGDTADLQEKLEPVQEEASDLLNKSVEVINNANEENLLSIKDPENLSDVENFISLLRNKKEKYVEEYKNLLLESFQVADSSQIEDFDRKVGYNSAAYFSELSIEEKTEKRKELLSSMAESIGAYFDNYETTRIFQTFIKDTNLLNKLEQMRKDYRMLAGKEDVMETLNSLKEDIERNPENTDNLLTYNPVNKRLNRAIDLYKKITGYAINNH